MAYLRLEDLTGSIEVIVFPDLYRVAVSVIKQEKPLLITGTLDKTEHGMKFKATTCRLLEGGGAPPATGTTDRSRTVHRAPTAPPEKTVSSLVISLAENTASSVMNNLKEILNDFPGDISVYLEIELPERSVMIDTRQTVLASSLLIAKIEILVGSGKVSQR